MVWYVLYTSAKAEKKVAERLREENVEVFLPLHRQKRRWSDRIKVVDKPLFGSYVFVKCTDFRLRELLLVYGVSRIVYYLGRPAKVRDSEIEAIKEFLQIAQDKEIITNGDQVDILCGPFKDKSAKVLNVGRDFATLVLEELGAKIYVPLLDIDKKKTEQIQ
ncbi:MAG: UpxY family transcription antiterminator [Bacteroidales bacterium]|nr:UpxY family transcription antiterminator [Bacteroidales bacterium]MDD3300395.1 UpxY family transcription antiterminator [Bacteroidales bacterium]MDD4618708.1 UpxY family transcription antiterminator [Bacteroidales bacterium]